MLTFAELYCAAHHCPPTEFRRRVFWRTLHPLALIAAPLLLPTRYFEPDRELIDACARATRLDQVYEEIREYPFHPRNRDWLRRRAKLRVSTRRLQALAQQFLRPKPAVAPPVVPSTP